MLLPCSMDKTCTVLHCKIGVGFISKEEKNQHTMMGDLII